MTEPDFEFVDLDSSACLRSDVANGERTLAEGRAGGAVKAFDLAWIVEALSERLCVAYADGRTLTESSSAEGAVDGTVVPTYGVCAPGGAGSGVSFGKLGGISDARMPQVSGAEYTMVQSVSAKARVGGPLVHSSGSTNITMWYEFLSGKGGLGSFGGRWDSDDPAGTMGAWLQVSSVPSEGVSFSEITQALYDSASDQLRYVLLHNGGIPVVKSVADGVPLDQERRPEKSEVISYVQRVLGAINARVRTGATCRFKIGSEERSYSFDGDGTPHWDGEWADSGSSYWASGAISGYVDNTRRTYTLEYPAFFDVFHPRRVGDLIAGLRVFQPIRAHRWCDRTGEAVDQIKYFLMDAMMMKLMESEGVADFTFPMRLGPSGGAAMRNLVTTFFPEFSFNDSLQNSPGHNYPWNDSVEFLMGDPILLFYLSPRFNYSE